MKKILVTEYHTHEPLFIDYRYVDNIVDVGHGSIIEFYYGAGHSLCVLEKKDDLYHKMNIAANAVVEIKVYSLDIIQDFLKGK